MENNMQENKNSVDLIQPNNVESFIDATGEGLFRFLVWAAVLCVVAMCLWFFLQSVYVFLVLTFSLISVFRGN